MNSEPKMPPSLQWALEDEDRIEEELLHLKRNSKANVHLAPLGSKLGGANGKKYGNQNNGSILTHNPNSIYGNSEVSIMNKIPSVKKLSSQKTRRLQPLRR